MPHDPFLAQPARPPVSASTPDLTAIQPIRSFSISPPVSRLLFVALFAALSAWTIRKSILPLVHTDEFYFWITTYGHGWVRRGLTGTLLEPVIGVVSAGSVRTAAEACSLLGLACLVLVAAADAWRGRVWPACVLGASPFLGLVAFHVGYPDGVIAAVILGVGALLPWAPAWAIAVALVLASAVHEMAFLLLVPVVVFGCTVRSGWISRDYAVVAAGGLAGLIFPLLAHGATQDVTARLVAAGVPVADAQGQAATFLHQGLAGAVARMAAVWRAYPVNGALGVIYAGLPGLCIAALGWPAVRGGTLARVSYWAACLSGVALLAIAWDLARVVSFTTLTAYVTVRLVGSAPSRWTKVAATACVVVFTALPVLNLYFDYGRPIRVATVAAACQRCASAGVAMADYFNRAHSADERAAIDYSPLYGGR